MRGHIIKRGNSVSIVVDDDKKEDGSRNQKWISGFRGKKEAEKALPGILKSLEDGTYVEPTKQTVSEYLDYWLKTYAKQNVSYKTYKRYDSIIKNHLKPTLGRTRLDKLRPTQIQEMYTKAATEKHLAQASVLYIHRVLSQALKHAVKWQLIVRNQTDAVMAPKSTRSQLNFMDEKTLTAILKKFEKEGIYIAVYLAATTGMRRGEVCGLKWDDFDYNNKVIRVQRSLQRIDSKLVDKSTKTEKSSRSVAIADDVIKVLKRHKKAQEKQAKALKSIDMEYNDHRYICANNLGMPYDPDYISRKFHKLVQAMNLNYRFHDLRHAHATLLLSRKIHPKVVAERLGHSEIRITMDTYSHVLPQMQQEAAEQFANILQTAAAKKPRRKQTKADNKNPESPVK